jgi:hypothetical protein
LIEFLISINAIFRISRTQQTERRLKQTEFLTSHSRQRNLTGKCSQNAVDAACYSYKCSEYNESTLLLIIKQRLVTMSQSER